jgi:hypothetical protein
VLDQSKRWREMREERGLINNAPKQLDLLEDTDNGEEDQSAA